MNDEFKDKETDDLEENTTEEDKKDSSTFTNEANNLDEISEEDLKNLLDNIEKDSDGKIKKINIGLGKRIFKCGLLEFIYEYIVFLVLAFSVNVLVKAISCPLYIFFIYILIYTLIYYFVKKLCYKKWSMIMILSFGLINLAISVISFFISGELLIILSKYIFNFYTFLYLDIGMVILGFVLFTILKLFIINYIFNLKNRIGRIKK